MLVWYSAYIEAIKCHTIECKDIRALFGFRRWAYLAAISDCLQPNGIVQGLLRLVMRSFLVNRAYNSRTESVLLCVSCVTTN